MIAAVVIMTVEPLVPRAVGGQGATEQDHRTQQPGHRGKSGTQTGCCGWVNQIRLTVADPGEFRKVTPASRAGRARRSWKRGYYSTFPVSS